MTQMMQLGGTVLDILLLALAIAALFKLRSVLGRRPRSIHREESAPEAQKDKDAAAGAPSEEGAETPSDSHPAMGIEKEARASLAALARAEPSFTPESFMRGAGGAYKMIVTAFAKGEKDILKRLLSEDVYRRFAAALDQREDRGEAASLERFHLLEARILSADLKSGWARIKMRLTSRQLFCLKDSEGRVIEGDPNRPQEKTDYWVFAKKLSAKDNLWSLAATGGS